DYHCYSTDSAGYHIF
nr:immunoglobulin light chain junction region [Macaca mulatta]MOW28263.1 immunoglobulin light chain junction region [Macaca mulatta]MOW30253.1 immunoglobulin light chain junction region [Macaca mulatta]MOW30460.1 immunoglobulin light chain junction region [Macaca mulatta]MOW30633.1 immunoglobulin light chain junction region [Macaca mulatta]